MYSVNNSESSINDSCTADEEMKISEQDCQLSSIDVNKPERSLTENANSKQTVKKTYSEVLMKNMPSSSKVVHSHNINMNNDVLPNRNKGRKEYLTGTSTNCNLSVAEKMIFLFVSRLSPSLSCNDVLDSLNKKTANYEIEKLKTRYPGYSSFKIGVPIALINEVYSADFWPSGAFISKFKYSKNFVATKEKDVT